VILVTAAIPQHADAGVLPAKLAVALQHADAGVYPANAPNTGVHAQDAAHAANEPTRLESNMNAKYGLQNPCCHL